MSQIIIITDGGPTLGMGHVIHSLAIAKEFEDVGIFALSEEAYNYLDMDQTKYFVIKPKHIRTLLYFIKPKVVIIDRLTIPDEILYACYHIKSKIVAFNCIDENIEDQVDLAVLPDASGLDNFASYDDHIKCGPKYWFLREEFKPRLKLKSNNIESILLTLGGGDTTNLINKIREVQPAGLFMTTLWGLQLSAKDIANKMYLSDLVICSPGLTPFESLLVGTPVIIIPQNEEQAKRYRPYLPIVEDIHELPKILTNADDCHIIRSDSKVVQDMHIGEGRQEVVEVIKSWLRE